MHDAPILLRIQVNCFLLHLGRGVGVSFKMRKRRETGKNSARRGQRRRAARLHQSFPFFVLHGYSRKALRPPVPPPVGPHPSPKAGHRAGTSSFLYFERDPHAPAKWQNRFCTGMKETLTRGWIRTRNEQNRFHNRRIARQGRESETTRHSLSPQGLFLSRDHRIIFLFSLYTFHPDFSIRP